MAWNSDHWRWGKPYTQAELERVQARWGLRFPPDLIAMYLRGRPSFLGPAAVDWTEDSEDIIQQRLDWPYESLCFDLEHNADFWWPEWGERPAKLEDCKALLKSALDAAPKLIPIFGHRYIPCDPYADGNPVFSVYQSDVIFYGANLPDYLSREMGERSAPITFEECKPIRFWTTAVQRNGLWPWPPAYL